MKCLVAAVGVVVFSCSSAAVWAGPAPGGAASVPAVQTGLAQKPEVADAIQLLEAWIESQMAYRGIPGLSLGIVYDQDLVWARGFGYADVEKKTPATPATLYRIASNSKMFTSVAVLQLRDAGKLGLDDPVQKHLTWFTLRNRQPGEAPVTIRNLLTHTGGLPREAAFAYWADLRFPTRKQIEESVPGQERVFPPYTKWKYSNLGLTLAGEIVETVSGEPYADYVRRHIFEPLGMSGSSVGVPEVLRPRLAKGYGRQMPDGTRSVRPFSDVAGLDPAGGLTSSVEDLAKFASLQFRDQPAGGAQILAGATLREMQRVQWMSPDWKGAWGLGFQIIRQDDRTLVGHGGWVAGYQTAFITWPQEKIAVIALTNADDGQPDPGTPFSVTDRFFKWVAPALKKAVELAPRKAARRPEWAEYLGTYRSPSGDSRVMVLADRLTLVSPQDVDPGATMLTLVEVAPHTFRTETEAPFGEDGNIVAFELDPQGKAVRMRFGADRLDRVGP